MKCKRVLAISSGGGHWVQLNRVVSAFEGHDVSFATVDEAYRGDVGAHDFYIVRDATRWSRIGLLVMAAQVLGVVLRVRPDVIISTGAAPGLLAVVFGRLLRARTIWLDSMANVDEVSMSGRLARRFVGLWLTQWPHLATPEGPEYAGQVL